LSERIPLPAYPDGWFSVGDSDDLDVAEVRPIHYLGRDLVLWRGEDGVARLFDAYCPHLGAHLGYGGCVEGDSIRCPFHAWRFGSDGACVEIPYAKRIPPHARVPAWHTCEQSGAIMAWHHAAGEPPSWQLPDVPEWGSAEWTAPVHKRYRVRTHAQEMAENIVDPAHFRFVHGTPRLPPTQAEMQGHVFRVESGLTFTTPRGEVQGNVSIASYGFGFGVSRFSGVIDTVVIITSAPIDEEMCETTLRFMVRRLGNEEAEANVARGFVSEIERQYAQDIPIWENKVHLKRPLLCDGDGPIALLRRWGEQFYSAPSRPA